MKKILALSKQKNLTIETAPKMEQAKTSDKPTIQI